MSKDKNFVVPIKEKALFSIGVTGQNMSYALISAWLFYFCTSILYINPALVGIFLGVARVWDAFNDAILGVIIDRRRFKTGEKLRPFLLKTPIWIGFLAVLLFTDIGLKSEWGKIIYIFVIFLIWDILYTVQDIAQWGMTSVITPYSAERENVSQWARIAGELGAVIPWLMPVLIGNVDVFGISEKTLFLICGLFLGLGGMSLSMLTYSAKERIRTEVPKESVWDTLNLLFKNKIVMLIIVANVLSSIARTLPPIYFFKYMVSEYNFFGLKIDGTSFVTVYTAVLAAPGFFAMFFATKLAKKVKGMVNVLIIANLADIIARVICYFIGYQGYAIFGVMAVMGVAGVPLGMIYIARTAIYGDALDYMEYKTGKRAEAVTFATQNLIEKALLGISTLVTGLVLAFLHFDEKLFDAGLPQSDRFVKWIWPIFMLGPIIGSFLYIVPLLFIRYPDSLRKKVEAELLKRRALKE